MRTRAVLAAIVSIGALTAMPVAAWDSAKFKLLTKIVHPTHSYLTEYAIGELKGTYAEIGANAAVIVEGANTELHELPVTGTAHGLDLDAKRREHKGTNAGSDDVAGWWADAKAAYVAGNTEQAWFIAGIMLHMVEDMGVPAHANGVYHQGTISEFDNFEAMAALNWKPDFSLVDRKDPGFADPSDYYRYSQKWTAADAPDYHDASSFSKTWITASKAERKLLSGRQARTAVLAKWTLGAIAKGFGL
jgi:hypothetical protein